jgi:hypothetical protein
MTGVPRTRVVVDPDDDIATVKALYALQASAVDTVVVPVTPRATHFRGLVWDILRALGKRRSPQAPVPYWELSWLAVTRWALAHGVCDLIVLYAQHIDEPLIPNLQRAVEEAGARLTLVYTRSTERVTTTATLDDVLTHQTARKAPAITQAWPAVPASHPLRFRYDCRLKLDKEGFLTVDAVLQDVYGRLGKWLAMNRATSTQEVARAVSVVLACWDDRQLTIRGKAADLALISARRPDTVESLGVTPVIRYQIRRERAVKLLAPIDPMVAARELVDYATELPPNLVALIGRDQITATTFMGEQPTPSITPLLRALAFDGGWRHSGRASTHSAGAPADATTHPNIDTLNGLLYETLHSGRRAIHLSLIPENLAHAVRALTEEDVLWLQDNYCGATNIAEYSIFQKQDAPIRSLSPTMLVVPQDMRATAPGSPAN